MRKLKISLAALVLASSGLAASSEAQVTETVWGGTTGARNWQDNANWIGGAFPNDIPPAMSLHKANLAVNLGAGLTVDLGASDVTIARLSIGSLSNPVASNIVSTTSGGASRLVFRNDDADVLTETEDADFNNDTVVDGRDFLIWQRGYLFAGDNINDRGDANLDDVVNELDLAIWQDQYGLGNGLFNIGTPAIESTGVAGVTNTISSPIHIKNQRLEIGGDRDLILNGNITYEGDANNANLSDSGIRVLTPGMTVTFNGNLNMVNSDASTAVDFNINGHPEAQGTLIVNGLISGAGDLVVGSADANARLPLSTVVLKSNNPYTGSFRAGRGNLILDNDNAIGLGTTLNDNGTPGDTSDDFFPRATYRQVGPANQVGYNIMSTDDARKISNEVVLAQWQTIKGDHSITFDGHVTQTNNRGFINMLPAGKTLNITGDLDIWETNEALERRVVIDGTGKTIISGTISDDATLAPGGTSGQDRRIQKTGTGVLVIDTAPGGNNHSGPEMVMMGNLHYADNDSLNVSTDIKAKIRSIGGAVGVDVHPAGQTLATNATFISKFDPTSVGGLMLSATDAATAINFNSAAFANVKNMSLAAPEGGITYTGALTAANNEYRLGGGTGTLVLPNAQLGGSRSLSVRNGGVVRLTGTNTYSGATVIESKYTTSLQEAAAADTVDTKVAQSLFLDRLVSPVLEIDDITNGGISSAGNPSSIGLSSSAASNLLIQGATLRYIGTGDTTDRLFTIGTAGATLDSSGTGALVFNSTGAVVSGDAADIRGDLDDFSGSPNVVYNTTTTRDVIAGMTISDPDPANINTDFTQAPCAVDGSNCIPAMDTQTPPKPVVVTGVSDNGKEIGLSASYPFIIKAQTRLVLGAVDRTFKLTGTSTAANVLAPVISDSVKGSKVGITKQGAGTWYLEGANTNTGPTLVEAGTLGGNGGVGGALTVNTGASFTPGTAGVTNGLGDFSVGGAFTLNSGAILGIQLGGTTAGSYDVLNVTGAANLSGIINLSTVSFSPAMGNAFTVLTAAGGITDSGLTISGLTGFTKSIVGNSLVLTKTAAISALASVPEPGSLVLMGLALAGFGFRRK